MFRQGARVRVVTKHPSVVEISTVFEVDPGVGQVTCLIGSGTGMAKYLFRRNPGIDVYGAPYSLAASLVCNSMDD